MKQHCIRRLSYPSNPSPKSLALHKASPVSQPYISLPSHPRSIVESQNEKMPPPPLILDCKEMEHLYPVSYIKWPADPSYKAGSNQLCRPRSHHTKTPLFLNQKKKQHWHTGRKQQLAAKKKNGLGPRFERGASRKRTQGLYPKRESYH